MPANSTAQSFVLTAAQANWIGIAIAAGFAFLASLVVFFLGRRRDHAQRLWERQCELYDDALLQVLEWRHVRQAGNPEFGPTQEDRDLIAGVSVRLAVIGHGRVEDRYESMVNAHWHWVQLARHLRESLTERPPVPGEEISRYRRGEREARVGADRAEHELRVAIRNALKRTPTLRGLGRLRRPKAEGAVG